MLPFTLNIRPGRPLHDQIVFAVTKAVVTAQLQPGDQFPSVRTLSQELQINPNTAMKAVATLVERGVLETRTGIGTSVARRRPLSRSRERKALDERVEHLVVDAKLAGLELWDVLEAVRNEWT